MGGARKAERPGRRGRPGLRALRPPLRRARGLAGTLGVTVLGAVVPGAGFLWTRRRLLGYLVLLPTLTLTTAAVWWVGHDVRASLDLVFDPTRLKVLAGVLAVGLLLWMVTVLTTYLLARPRERTRTQSFLGGAFVLVLCLAVGAPVALGARYALVQADLVGTVFEGNQSATTPEGVSEEDPWGGRDRVNLLLLGGDGGVHRIGVRTDSMILVSMDTRTGRTVMFSLPRNLMNARFPVGSPLHDLYPDGFAGEGDPGQWMLNAVYKTVPELHPGILGATDNEGADALKQAVEGTLGLPVDYYLLVNLRGFREIVDAMGGVTVNINQPIPVGGNTDLGIPPDDYLQPGPDQRLDGFEALWYSRGRYGSDDYQRMERQRCMIDAIIDEAQPLTLIRRYQSLAEAGKKIVRSDVPSDLLPAFVDLALEVKDADVRSVVFRSSEQFSPGDPDVDWMHAVVRRALEPPAARVRPDRPAGSPAPSPSGSPGSGPSDSTSEPAEPESGQAVDARDTCAYDPVG